MVAAALLGPLLAWPFAWLVGQPLAALRSAPGLLAWANTRANLRRTASVATPLMLAISVVSSLYIAKSILHKDTHRRRPSAPPPPSSSARATPRDCHATSQQLHGDCTALPDASGTIATSLVVAADGKNLRPFPARGVDFGTLAARSRSSASSPARWQILHGNGCRRQHARAARMGLENGRPRPRLARRRNAGDRCASSRNTRARSASATSCSRGSLVERHVTQPLDDAVFVTGKPGVGASELERQLRTLRAADPTIAVVSRSDYETAIDRAAEKQSLAVYVLLGLIVVFCALALVNALTMAIGERAREFAHAPADRRDQASGAGDGPHRDGDHGRVRTDGGLADRSARACACSTTA